MVGLINAGQMAAQRDLQKNSKKALQLQESTAASSEQRERALMQQVMRQTDLLVEIRDLLKAQQTS